MEGLLRLGTTRDGFSESLSDAARRGGGEGERDTLRCLRGARRGSSSLLLSAALLTGERDADLSIADFLAGEEDGDRCPFAAREVLGGDFDAERLAARLGGDLDGERDSGAFFARGGDLDLDLEGEAVRLSLRPASARGDLERPRDAFTFSFRVPLLDFFDLRAGALESEDEDEDEDEELLEEDEPELLELDELDPLLLSLSLLLLLELLLELDPLLLEELEESLSLSEELLELLLSPPLSSFKRCCSKSWACICSASSLGAFFRCSLKPSVRLPRPMEVKKLIANRVFLALSVGKRPENTSCMKGSLKRSLTSARPIISDKSCTRILMKIREEEVVSYSFSLIYSMQVQGSASVHSKCPKNLATLRSLFVSSR